ncbi:MAG: metal-dependent transcriptional regulator [Oscillospiraceae bacterium]|nr:metal-dependent transcriptional regulator [Oscillospiraceae bacterium]
MAITESVADYLEAIMVMQQEKKYVRAVDIANHFGYSRPTVSQTLKTFRAKGYVHVDDDGFITLTEEGLAIANATYERHVVLENVLKFIGVSAENAEKDACRIEHDLSDETFSRICEVYRTHQNRNKE